MTTFKLTINCDPLNPDEYPEVSRILRQVAEAIEQGKLSIYEESEMALRDINGNTVGKAEFVE